MANSNPAAIPNKALEPLSILIGEWKTVGTHPFMPGVELHGSTSFEWLEGGAFISMHSSIDHEEFPSGIAIFGSDAGSDEFTMMYFDERNISRKYSSTFKENLWKWWRNDAEFSQRYTCTIKDDGNTIISKGEMKRNGGEWEQDLQLIYTRVLA